MVSNKSEDVIETTPWNESYRRQGTEPALRALSLDGTLVLPGDPDWHAARQAWHLNIDQQPIAVVQADPSPTSSPSSTSLAGWACGSLRRPPATMRIRWVRSQTRSC